MVYKRVISLALLFLLLSLMMIEPISHTDMTVSSDISSMQTFTSQSRTVLDQNKVKSSDLIRGAFGILESRWKTSTQLVAYLGGDSDVYYGQAGGLAGIGQALVDLLKINSPLVSQDTRNRMEAMIIQIANELNETGYVNATHHAWPVRNSTSTIELGWDFGIAGISAFFVDMYSYFNITQFLDIARNGYRYIFDHINNTGNWQSYLISHLSDSFWYPDRELEELFPPGTVNATFTGRSLGITGVAQSVLNYIRYGNASDPIAQELLADSLDMLNNQLIFDGNSTYAHHSLEGLPSVSMNQATGVSGIGEFYLDMYAYTENETYLDLAEGIARYLIGFDDGMEKYTNTWIRNGTLLGSIIELGQEHGVAGIVEYFLDIAEVSGNSTYAVYARSAADFLLFQAQLSGNILTIGDYLKNGQLFPSGQTTSWAYGGGGIYAAIFDVGQYYSSTYYLDEAEKMKSYLRSATLQEGGYTAIESELTGLLENNPSFGLPGSLRYLTRPSRGQIQVTQLSLDFGEVLDGSIQTKSIAIENTGEVPLTASWSNLGVSSAFRTQNFSAVIGELATFQLPVEFRAEGEVAYEDTLQVFGETTSFNVSISAMSYDNPQLAILEGITSDTTLENRDSIDIVANATDLSGIIAVGVDITGDDTTSFALNPVPETTLFNATWTPSLANGSYTMTFTATDTLGHTTEISYSLEVAIYTTPLEEQLFSPTTAGILVGVIVLGVGLAIILTRRFMN